MADISALLSGIPTEPEDVPLYLQQAIPALVEALQEAGDMQRKLDVEPDKPREGDLRYADGTNWDPGSGAGLYRYTSAAWVLIMGSGGAGIYLPLAGGTLSGALLGGQAATLGAITATDLTLSGAAASPPDANTVVKDNVCKGWINLDGTGTISIRDSFNVDSITDSGTGDYTVTWDRDFANANYSVAAAGAHEAGVAAVYICLQTQLVGSIHLQPRTDAGTFVDNPIVCIQAFGDQ